MEKTVFGYVWQYSRPQQIVMTLMSAASLPFLYLYYEVPKTIINQAIQGIRVEYPLNISNLLYFFLLLVRGEIATVKIIK